MECRVCGELLREGARFCPKCGTKIQWEPNAYYDTDVEEYLPDEESEIEYEEVYEAPRRVSSAVKPDVDAEKGAVRWCGKCGKPLKNLTSKFCPYCGAAVQGDKQESYFIENGLDAARKPKFSKMVQGSQTGAKTNPNERKYFHTEGDL